MERVVIVTPPDKVYSDIFKILLIYPDQFIKTQIKEYVKNKEEDTLLYFYDENIQNHNYEWLLSTVQQSDIVILSIDELPIELKDLTSYFLSKNNVYWLTRGENPIYNLLSVNRIYNLDFLNKTGV